MSHKIQQEALKALTDPAVGAGKPPRCEKNKKEGKEKQKKRAREDAGFFCKYTGA
jgi:hypothetical protein